MLILVLMSWTPGALATVPAPDTHLPERQQQTFTFWALDGVAGKRFDALQSCHVVLEGSADATEKRLPCGEPTALAAGSYRYWLETDAQVSPARYVLDVAALVGGGRVDEAWTSAREIETPVVASGLIGLSPQASVTPATTLVLIHTDSHSWQRTTPGHALVREATGEALTGGVRMPAGRVFAAAYDRTTGLYAALARPGWVYAGTVTYVTPQPPAPGTGDCWVVLERPRDGDGRHAEIRLQLHGRGGSRSADVVIDEQDRVQGIWFGLAQGPTRLSVESTLLELAGPSIVAIPSGRVTAFRGALRAKPVAEDVAAYAPRQCAERLARVRCRAGARLLVSRKRNRNH